MRSTPTIIRQSRRGRAGFLHVETRRWYPLAAGGDDPDPTPDPTPDPPAPDPAPDPPAPDPKPAPTQADLDKAYAKLREAEAERDRLAKAVKDREDAEKSELELAQQRVAELEGQVGEGQNALRKARLLAELAKAEHGIVDPDLAADLIDVTYDTDGRPQDVKQAVEKLLEARPYLKAQPPAPGSPGNPEKGRDRGGKMTAEEVKQLAKSDPKKFNELFEKGEIPASALGG